MAIRVQDAVIFNEANIVPLVFNGYALADFFGAEVFRLESKLSSLTSAAKRESVLMPLIRLDGRS